MKLSQLSLSDLIALRNELQNQVNTLIQLGEWYKADVIADTKLDAVKIAIKVKIESIDFKIN